MSNSQSHPRQSDNPFHILNLPTELRREISEFFEPADAEAFGLSCSQLRQEYRKWLILKGLSSFVGYLSPFMSRPEAREQIGDKICQIHGARVAKLESRYGSLAEMELASWIRSFYYYVR